MILWIIIGLVVGLCLSLIANLILFWYIRKTTVRFFVASEEASKIFSMIDAYQEHLQSVYEQPTFYGDETLKSLLDHTKDMTSYMKQYEDIYSFTQPDLEEQLLAASIELENYDEEKTTDETQE